MIAVNHLRSSVISFFEDREAYYVKAFIIARHTTGLEKPSTIRIKKL